VKISRIEVVFGGPEAFFCGFCVFAAENPSGTGIAKVHLETF
jgi:hypothetical protein